jgi:hypothetical protein
MVYSLIYLAKELVIQKIRLNFQKRLFEKKHESPGGIELLLKLESLASIDKDPAGGSPTREDLVRDTIMSAFETEQQTASYAKALYEKSKPKESSWRNFNFTENVWGRYGLSPTGNTSCQKFGEAVLKIRKESRGAIDVVRAINDLNSLCWLVIVVLWAVTAGEQVTILTAKGF